MNDDFPWFLLAMVFIAFLRWVSLRLQGKSGASEHDFTEFEDENVFAETEQGPEPSASGAGPGRLPGEEIRRFFEALGGGAPAGVEQAPKPTTPASPPPVPRPKDSTGIDRPPRPASLGADHTAAYQIRPKKTSAVRGAPGPGGESQVRSLLASSDGLKSAVLLREILGEPKGLKGFEDSPRF